MPPLISCTRREPPVARFECRVRPLSGRPRPGKRDVVIIPMFSEFGCETLAAVYCLPALLRTKLAGKFVVVVGWAGREFLYRGLADEFWELAPDLQHLRDFARAFHHDSRNLKRFERQLAAHGRVLDVSEVASVAVCPRVPKCLRPGCAAPVESRPDAQVCAGCGARWPAEGFFGDLAQAPRLARWLPAPSREAGERVKKYLPPRAVGITARNRKTYGRNLPLDFYRRLVVLVENMGYSPVWLGEPQSTHPCPFARIPDFSRSDLWTDLESTFALVGGMEFTVQFYTASSRLAAMVGTPYLLVESPDQLWGAGQEGIRLNLLTRGNRRKVIAAQFLDARDRPGDLLALVERGVEEIERGYYGDGIGLGAGEVARLLMAANGVRVGDFLRGRV